LFKRIDLLDIFKKIINLIFGIMLLFITLGLVIGVFKMFLSLGTLFSAVGVTGHYLPIISDVLTLFILVELSRSLVDYFHEHRLRLTFIIDAGIVFVLREVMISLFKQELAVDQTFALSALLLVLGLLRIGSVLMFQREKRMLGSFGDLPVHSQKD